jgi:DNA polymerase-3 subunit gamma/tau
MVIANNNLDTLQDIVALLEQHGALIMAANVAQYIELVKLEQNRIECSLGEGCPAKLPADLAKKLSDITGSRWFVSLTSQTGAPTLRAQEKAKADSLLRSIEQDPIVKSVLETFHGAKIIEFKKI